MDKKDERAEERQRNEGLTDEESKEKERLMRYGELIVRHGSGEVPERFRKIPKTREERRALIREIARSGRPEDIRPGRPIPEEFWTLPRPKDPEGLLLKALLDDREQGR